MTLRRGESVLLTLGIPVGLLVFFSGRRPARPRRPRRHLLAPGILALAVMSTAMVSLGIATGFERQYGRAQAPALDTARPPALLAAKTARHRLLEIVQMVVLVAARPAARLGRRTATPASPSAPSFWPRSASPARAADGRSPCGPR